MRGFSSTPGLVEGEACRVTIRREVPKGVDFIGAEPPAELFGRPLDAIVHLVGGRRPEGGQFASVRLADDWLDDNTHPQLKRLFGAEPPSPFPYEIVPRHYLNGWTRESDLNPGDTCFIWVKAEGDVPWLERAPDLLPSEFPSYPHPHLVGFWQAKVKAVLRSRDGSPVRKLRAVLIDSRIRDHQLRNVRELYGHEPWTDYWVTRSDNEILEAGSELLGEVVEGAKRLGRLLELPEWLKRPPGSSQIWQPEDFDS